MLSLTKIFLHNWHRFHHHVIDIEDSLYLAGHNGSGKSSILDAIQFVLVADLRRVKFNSSAQDHSTRTLDTYVRGKLGENRFLRPGDTVAYLALEFSDKARDEYRTLGMCIETGENRPTDCTYFTLLEPLDEDLFVPEGKALTRRELRQILKTRRGAHTFEQAGEYQREVLNRLGGLNERFFQLFLRALTFQPIRNIRGFVEQWLLEEQRLDVGNLQRVQDRLHDLRRTADQVQTRLDALDEILAQQTDARRADELCTQYKILILLLEGAQQDRVVTALTEQCASLALQIRNGEAELAQIEHALKSARDAHLDAQLRLRESSAAQKRSELERQIREAGREIEAIQLRRAELVRAFQAEAAPLEQFLRGASLEPAPLEILHTLARYIRTLDRAKPLPPGLPSLLDQAIPILDDALDQVQQEQFRLNERIKTLRARGQELEGELDQLKRGGTTYPRDVERMRDLIVQANGTRPLLLCELVEIPDELWQDAVEALLGARRYTLIVPPEQFDAALHVVDTARAHQQIYDVRLLDLAKAHSEARPARPRSLALQVTTGSPLLRAYLDTILGDMVTCETVDELRTHRRAVTPQVVIYQEWSVRAAHPREYRPWIVGKRAQRSQIEARESELQAISRELAMLAPQVQAIEARVKQLQRGRTFAILRSRLDAPLDEATWLAQQREAESELAELDLADVRALEAEIERLQQLITREQQAQKHLTETLGGSRAQLAQRQTQFQSAQLAHTEKQNAVSTARSSVPTIFAAAQELAASRIVQPDLDKVLRDAESAMRGFGTRGENARAKLIELASTYNLRFQFFGMPHDPTDPRYDQEHKRLTATELPRYRGEIEQAEREAEEELREHVLHRLREQILGAKQTLQRINDALAPLDFRGERYQFRSLPAEDTRPYYDLIMEAQVVGTGALFQSQFYRDHKAVFQQFYEGLSRTPQNEHERTEQAALEDYRRYLEYDIEVKHSDGRLSRLSKIMDQTSGGETQTPFYLTIAASFVQLYHLDERSSRSTIRLVAFDEAFSKMDQDRIGSTLELFQKFQLQIITATPLERCEYLVPKMCTNLVLTLVRDRDTVLIEPYRNYAARLQETDLDSH